MSDDAVVIGVVLLVAGTIGFTVGSITSRATGYSYGIREVACPALLTNAPSLADSLAVAKKYEECEWWTEADR